MGTIQPIRIIYCLPNIKDEIWLSASHLPSTHFFFFFNFWLCWVFVAPHGLSLVVESWGYSLLQCMSFSLWWLLLLWSMGSRHTGSVVVAHRS